MKPGLTNIEMPTCGTFLGGSGVNKFEYKDVMRNFFCNTKGLASADNWNNAARRTW